MIFEPLRKRFAAQDWVAVAIELAIVGVGVFLGMQANNWNQERLDRARAQSYRVRLIEDLRQTERGMLASALYYGDMRRHALAALVALDQPATQLGRPFLIDAYQATQIFPRPAKHSTYDEILASGNAELIGSPEVRTRIANFYWRMDGLVTLVSSAPPYREKLRSVMPYEAEAAIRRDCDEVIMTDETGLSTARLPPTCTVRLDDSATRRAVAAVVATPGIKQDLNRVMIDLDVKLQQFEKLRRGAFDLRRYLASDARP